ncbi:hypothetical protein [uncultured Gimesia sp.]|uniref:hypothetical protein n=1 Tax=uncultured Gimesia sp. TaxID=1678688 RepID=UPI0030DA2E35|tara:strand:+ start:67538 stop:68479 length:942 start_codon:yes stop_codon:yes gene_type:complete
MSIQNEPLLTSIYEEHSDFCPVDGSIYLALDGIEERSGHFTELRRAASNVFYFDVVREGKSDLDIQIPDEPSPTTFRLRSRKQLNNIWERAENKIVYLDITGLRHHIWIPLLRSAVTLGLEVRVIYVEPNKYTPSPNPTEGQMYDLSERIEGIAPIPGCATFARTGDDFLFLPLLGFEGTRVAYLIEKIQPIDDKIIPIVGVPGFRPEHPFSTYLGNRIALQESNAWQRVKFADANCPFSLYYLLEEIRTVNSDAYFKIAVVGTKPHALGAVLYTLQYPDKSELIYDHPIRKSERTSGIGKLLEYDISGFRNG